MYLLLLNRANLAIGIKQLSTGGTAGVVYDTKIVFQSALLAHASGIILAHNHPSGNLTPSSQDIAITNTTVNICKLFGMVLYDHLILTPYDGYYSFSDNGLVQPNTEQF